MSAASSQPRRRWFQYSLRGLLLLVVLVAFGAYAYRAYVEPYRRQREALKALAELGATVQTSAPTAWQRRLFGDDFVNITVVELADCDEPEKYLPHVAGLPDLEVLVVGGLSFRDDHLQRLRGLPSLKLLVLDSTAVSREAISVLEVGQPQIHVLRSQRRAVAALRDRPGAVFPKQQVHVWEFEEWIVLHFDVSEHFREMVEADIALGWNDTEADLLAGLPWLKCLHTLKKLSLKGRIKDEHLVHLEGLSQLESLYLANTDITDAGLAHVATLTGLRSLDLSTTNVTGAGVRHLQSLRQLREFHLRGTNTDDTGLQSLRPLTELRELFLAGSDITDAGLAHLAALQHLEWLDLGHTAVTDAGMAHLAKLSRLKHLDLGSTKVGDAGLAHWQGLAELEYAGLDNSQVTDAGLKNLRSLPRLKEVWLLGAKVTKAGVRDLQAAIAGSPPRAPQPAALPAALAPGTLR